MLRLDPILIPIVAIVCVFVIAPWLMSRHDLRKRELAARETMSREDSERFARSLERLELRVKTLEAILDDEEHVGQIAHLTTLAGYVHWQLTGDHVLGVGDASGMFPINVATGRYDPTMIATFNDLVAERGLSLDVAELLPGIRVAGEPAGRLTDDGARRSVVNLVNNFRDYFRRYDQPIDENPSPGNKDGGITTLAEKSLGCVQKGGRAPVKRVLEYGEPAPARLGGLALVNAPGNDGVSSTAMTIAGAQVLLFTFW